MVDDTKLQEPESWRGYFAAYRETARVLAWVWNELTSQESRRWALAFVFLSGVLLSILTIQPLVFGWVVSSMENEHKQLVVIGLWVLGGLTLLQRFGSMCNHMVREWLWNRNMLQMHNRLNDLFYEKTLGQHSDEGSELNYESIEKAKNRVDGIQEMLLFETVQVVFTIVAALSFSWYLRPEVGAVLTVILLVHAGWSLYLNYHVSVDTASIERDFRRENRQMVERWNKLNRVKTSGKSRSERRRLSKWFDDILRRDRKFWFWFNYHATAREVVGDIVRLLVIAYSVYLVYIGEEEIGFLIPVYTWVTQVVQNLWYFGHAERRINEQIPYIRAMRDALSIKPSFDEEIGVSLEQDMPIAVQFKDIELYYGVDQSGEQLRTLRDINFAIAPGEKVALIGPSGAGKSSIMKLLLRFMDPSDGEIWVNGHLLNEVRLVSWMERVGYIPQDAQVFDGTIRYNMIFGLSEERQAAITDEEIWDVMRLLKIDFGSRLTDGLDTVVGRDGMKLSGGERQRLMAGAAVIKRPIFMVIDEATSSLDSTTEKAVQEGLQQVLYGPTGALIVAHRLSTVRTICDRFMVLRKPEDTPEGESQIEAAAPSFEELYQISPTFRGLADDQGIKI